MNGLTWEGRRQLLGLPGGDIGVGLNIHHLSLSKFVKLVLTRLKLPFGERPN